MTSDIELKIVAKISAIALLFIGIGACSTSAIPDATRDDQIAKDPVTFARQNLIVDTHIDTPYANYLRPRAVLSGDATIEFDYPRAVAGGLNAPFMSIYVPPRMEEDGTAYEFANSLIDQVEAWVRDGNGKFKFATCVADVRNQFASDSVSLPMGMENGGPIAGDYANVVHFYNRGIRYVTLAHSKTNHISDSSYDENEQWGGLSPFGKSLVPKLNDIGIMIDISHLTDKAAWQVLELSKSPVIASHSSLREFIPGFHRNMSSKMVKSLGQQGGIIMINFGSGFVSNEARQWRNDYQVAVSEYSNQETRTPEDLREFRIKYQNANPYPFATVETVVDHIDRVVELAGIDNVGLGSDFDGVGPTLPIGLEDVSKFPNLVKELWNRGYSDEDVRKILGTNFLKVWKEVENFATEQGNVPICQAI